MPRITKAAADKAAAPTPAPKGPVKTAPQKALDKLGLVRPIDLALHIPLRYEDETQIIKLSDARDGDHAQIEGEVTRCEVVIRGRRQLVVTLEDGTDVCTLRFLNFYPSQQKQLAVGQHIRARGTLSGGMFGWSMLHPVCKSAGGALPTALTPVYSTVAGLSQPYLRRAVLSGLEYAAKSGALDETLPEQFLHKNGTQPKENLHFCTTRRLMCLSLNSKTAATRHGSGSSWKSCWPSNCRSCNPNASVMRCARLCCPPAKTACATSCWLPFRSRSPPRSNACVKRLRKTLPSPSPCTACCKAT
jgi:hypothetical protein